MITPARRLSHLELTQEEHAGGWEEEAGQGLDGSGDEAEGGSRYEDDGGGDYDHGGVGQVEGFGLVEAAVKRMADPEHVAEGITGRQGDRCGADDAGVEEENGEEGAEAAALGGEEVGYTQGVCEFAEGGGTAGGVVGGYHDGCGSAHHHQ